MTSEELNKRYEDKRKEIREYMKIIGDALVEKYSTIPDAYLVSLDMLVFNLEILYASIDEMGTKGLTSEDKYHGTRKSSGLQAFFNAQAYIHKIINSFGLTPMAKSKLREKQDEIDLKEYLDEITK